MGKKAERGLTGDTPGRTYAHELFEFEGIAEGDVDGASGPVFAQVPGAGDIAGGGDLKDVLGRDEPAGVKVVRMGAVPGGAAVDVRTG